jgi:signal transduction histidine kinase
MRSGYKLFISSVIFGLLVWFSDSVLDSLFFYEGSFLDLLILDIPKHEIYFRSLVLIFFTIFGIIIAWLFSKRKQAEGALQKAHDELENRVEERTAKLSEANKKLRRQIIERKKAENALQESEKELRLLSKQLLFAEENERKRIADKLHEGIGQELSAIKLSVENSLDTLRNYSGDLDLKALEATIPVAQKAIEDVRKIVNDLRPYILDVLGILPAISWIVEEFQKSYSGIRLKKDITVKENEIAVVLKTVIFRILQEALSNIAEHSQADNVRLNLKKSEDKIELIIEDNGVGFDERQILFSEPSKRGFGLAGMRERTELSAGTFAIKSANGNGTILSASWPL